MDGGNSTIPFHMFRPRRRRPHTPNDRHGDRITKTLGMQHVILRVDQVIPDHLSGLGLLQWQVLLIWERLNNKLIDPQGGAEADKKKRKKEERGNPPTTFSIKNPCNNFLVARHCGP